MTEAWAEGVRAQRAGVKWWNNPYPSGGVPSYEWDQGHTTARLRQ